MKYLLFNFFWLVAYADPFYYGENSMPNESLNLYGLMQDRANFNGKWYKVQTIFEAQNTSWTILKIQNHCVFLQDSTQTPHKICLLKSNLLRN
ncbi:hypothetical protein [uncultured Helicobacter sp.]|uniref:hypothetical protein n=1 Tax=uncultured Helicobacter sp. TaxID=175537 RepID=UPI002607D290|nr:hypothetical protein [uncultured Helicobacter sp.]